MVQECRYFSKHVGFDVVVFDCGDPDFPDEKTDFLLIDAGELIFVVRCQDNFSKKRHAVLGDEFLIYRDEFLRGQGFDLFDRDCLLDQGFFDCNDVAACIGRVETIDQIVGRNVGHVVAKYHVEPVQKGGFSCLPLLAYHDQDWHKALGVQVQDLEIPDAQLILLTENMPDQYFGPVPGAW